LHYSEVVLALIFVGAGIFLASQITAAGKIPQEAGLACLYILGAGLSVLLLSKIPRGESNTLSVFFGNVLSLGISEVWESLAILLITIFVLRIWFHRWIWIAFDPVSAEVSKIKIKQWNFLFFSLFALAMTICIHIFGVLLAFSYLLMPAAAALLLVRNLRTLFILIPIFTTVVTIAGFYFSFQLDFPTGPFIASLLAGLVLAAGIYRRWLTK
jgi:ABC-type Mn2+/Zn2+ transport system permease subunit